YGRAVAHDRQIRDDAIERKVGVINRVALNVNRVFDRQVDTFKVRAQTFILFVWKSRKQTIFYSTLRSDKRRRGKHKESPFYLLVGFEASKRQRKKENLKPIPVSNFNFPKKSTIRGDCFSARGL